MPTRKIRRSIKKNQAFQKQRRSRLRLFEQLENRLLLASDWQNPSRPPDVDNNLVYSPLDVLVVINAINNRGLRNGAIELGPRTEALASYVDTNGDTFLTPLDVLVVINHLNSLSLRGGAPGVPRVAGLSEEGPGGFLSTVVGQLDGIGDQQIDLATQLAVTSDEFNEMGVFLVDDASGTLNGVPPSSPLYGREVWASPNRRVLFSRRDLFRTESQATLPAGGMLAIYVLQQASADSNAASHLQLTTLDVDSWVLDWEEHAAAGPLTFNDASVRIDVGQPYGGCGDGIRMSDWQVEVAGGGGSAVPTAACTATLSEGSSFEVGMSRQFVVPAEPAALRVEFNEPTFDVGSAGTIRDAFEIAVYDASGRPVVFPHRFGEEAAFNLTESLTPSSGTGTESSTADGRRTVELNLAHLPAGSIIRLTARLVNNDADAGSSVVLRSAKLVAAAAPSLLGGSSEPEAARDSLDLPKDRLVDLTAEMQAAYGITTLIEGRDLRTDVAVQNIGGRAVIDHLIVAIEIRSDAEVGVLRPDGFLADGRAYFDFSDRLADGTLRPGSFTGQRTIGFRNPTGSQFTYELSVLGTLNAAPDRFVSRPEPLIEAGRQYAYRAQVSEPDGQPLAYSIQGGPAGASIDASSGQLLWQTAAADVGSYRFVVRASDPHGLFIEQSFDVEVRPTLENRPPVFVSDPVTDAIASSGFEVTTVAAGNRPAGVAVIGGFIGPRLVSINAGEQTIGVYTGTGNDRFDNAAFYSTGEPRPTDSLIDVGYSVDVGLPRFLRNSDWNEVLGLTQSDFNGDGILDLATLVASERTIGNGIAVEKFEIVRVLGDGDGGFSSPLVVASMDLPNSWDWRNLVAGDVNGDGNIDLLATERRTSTLMVVLGVGDGSFLPQIATVYEKKVSDFRIEDVDEDGNADLIGMTASLGFGATYELMWMRGTGDGTFAAPTMIAAAGSASNCCYDRGTRSFDVADLNGDGHLDIVAVGPDEMIEVFHSDGDGNFASVSTIDPPGGVFGFSPDWIRVGDFAGDDALDIAYVHLTNGRLDLLVGDGSGSQFVYRQGSSIHHRSDNWADDLPIDIDGDGDLDLAFGSWVDSAVATQVLINDGDGNFTVVNYAAVDFPGQISDHDQVNFGIVRGVLFGDYNRDGVIDFSYFTNGDDFNGVGVRLGTHPGQFGASRSIVGTANNSDTEAHAGDFNGDGIVDLLSLPSMQMLLGRGDGTFAEPFPALSVARPGPYAAVADFNLDGADDYVAVRALQNGSRYYVAIANGDGSFSVSDDKPTESSFYGYSATRIADFNNDGYPDFIAKAGVERHIDVHLNDPKNPGVFERTFRFTVSGQGTITTSWDQSFAVADFTGDGLVDIAFADELPNENKKLVIFAGDGAGGFSPHSESFAYADELFEAVGHQYYEPGDFGHGDLDHDGDIDLVSFTTAGVRVHLNQGDGTFETVDSYPVDKTLSRGRDSYVVDFDADGHLDLVESGSGGESLKVRRGRGDGTFGESQRVGLIGQSHFLSFADLDHDGLLDAAYVIDRFGNHDTPGIAIYAGRRDGLVDMLATDLNGDGNDEILAINEQNDRLKLFVGDNLGGLTRQIDLFTGRAPRAVAVGDLDGDGGNEIITANRAGRSITVFTGSLASGYSGTDHLVGNGPIDVLTADVDGDGDIDVLTIDETDNAMWVLAGDGDRTFALPVAFPLGDRPGKLAYADATGDGVADAIITLPASNRLMILPGLAGSLNFAAPLYVALPAAPADVAAIDLNADGRIDLATPLPGLNVLGVLYGLGSGQFASLQQIAVGAAPSRVTAADADADGRIDLIVANSGDDTLSVVFNRFDPNEVYRYDSQAVDPDGEDLTYSIVDGPGGLIIDRLTGDLLWAASPDQVGVHEVTISADDARGGVATQTFKIDVRPARENATPIIASVPVERIGAGDDFFYDAAAIDRDGDPLRYRIVSGPEGAEIDPTTGVLQWDGRTTQAMQFYRYGRTGEVLIPADASLQPTSLTVEGWFNYQSLVPSNGRGILFTQANQIGVAYQLYDQGNRNLLFRMDLPAPAQDFTLTVPFVAELDRWYHIAVSFDDATRVATIFLDGKAIASGTAQAGIQYDPAADFYIGDGGVYYTRATIDNYRMWNVPRSAEELQQGMGRQYDAEPRLVLDYRFGGPETYTVRDNSPAGNHGIRVVRNYQGEWVEGLAETGAHSFTISVEDGRGGVDLQSFTLEIVPELRGNLRGTLFDDMDRDGIKDASEPAIAGRVVYLDVNGNGYPDAGEATVTTATNGTYRFDGLLPGNYPLVVASIAGYATPASIDAVIAVSQATVVDLAITQLGLSQIRGQLLTEGGQAISNWRVWADLDEDGLFDAGEPSAVSDPRGDYALAGLTAGTYRVRPDLPAGWANTAGSEGLEVTLAADVVLASNDFVLAPNNTSVTAGVRFLSMPPAIVEARQTYRYAAVAQTILGEAVRYDLPLAPEGMAVDPATGLIAWRPNVVQAGRHTVVLRATAADGSIALQDWEIDVAAPNTAPVLSLVPDAAAFVGLTYAVDLLAQDAEGQTITFALVGGPAGASLDPVSGALRWMPAAADVGDVDVTIAVRDALGAENVVTFVLTVADAQPSSLPFAILLPRTAVGLGQEYVAKVVGSDALGRPLAWSLVDGPEGLVVLTDGSLRWTPAAADLGVQSVELLAVDPDGNTRSVVFELSVSGRLVNSSPSIASSPLERATLGGGYRYDVMAVDADRDPLSFALVQAPAGMSIHPSLGTVRWSPQADQLGPAVVELQVTDPSGATATQRFSLNVSRFGGPPRLTSTPPTEASVGTAYRYTVTAIDAEGDPLQYRLLAAPAGMTIVESTGEIVWTPTLDQIGRQAVVVQVSDGAGGAATQAFAILVSEGIPNQPPNITSAGPRFGAVGTAYSYLVAASDPEGTTLTYSLGQAPVGMSIDPATGLVSWTPEMGQAGRVIVTFIATDEGGAAAVESFALDVLATNNAPAVQAFVPRQAVVGAAFTYQIIAADADLDPLRYELITAPTGAAIDDFGRIMWRPDAAAIGTHDFTVSVRDPRGGQASLSFQLEVVADTEPPKLSLIETPNNASRNVLPWQGPFRVYVRGIDNVAVASITLTANGQNIPLDAAGTAVFTFEEWEFAEIMATATVTDTSGNATTRTIVFDYDFPQGWGGSGSENVPTAVIASPVADAAVVGMVTISGTAAHEDFDSYRLSYRRVDETAYTEFAQSNVAVESGGLGVWDTTLLNNDQYVLRLEVATAAGAVNVAEVDVGLAGELKLGNFRLTFTDMVIPVAGIPIEVTRVYDTLQSDREGDFGYGWRLEYRDTDLRVGVPASGLEDIGIYSPLRPGVKVYLNVPGQGRQGFTFNPDVRVLPGFGGNNLVLARPRFTPDPGVTSSLATGTSGYLQVNERGELFAPGGIPYNPASPDFGGAYVLTTRDGVRYRIDGASGKMMTAVDRNGNTVVFDEIGIRYDSGLGLTISRDLQGRIARITDPDGESIRYEYSGGDLTRVVDRVGNATRYVYDDARDHYLSEVIDPLGQTGLRTNYNANGRLNGHTNPLVDTSVQLTQQLSEGRTLIRYADGSEVIVRYDNQGRTTEVADPLGRLTQHLYDANGLSQAVDPLGQVTSYRRDSSGRILTETLPDGSVRRFTYDSNGRLATQIDELGRTTHYRYDSNGNLIEREFDGEVTQFEYDARGNLLREISAEGAVRSHGYDRHGYLTETVEPSGFRIGFTRDASGRERTQTTTLTDSNGQSTAVTIARQYNANGDETTRIDSTGARVAQAYDPLGNLETVTDQYGRTSTFEHSGTSLLHVATFGDGSSVRYVYDEDHQVVQMIDRAGNSSWFEYDVVGNRTAWILDDRTPDNLEDNPRYTYEYDALDREIAVTDPTGSRTSRTYNPRGRVTSNTDAAGHVTYFEYDAAGRLIRELDEAGFATSYTLDAYGNRIAIRYADGSQESFEYDDLGRVVLHVDPTGYVQRQSWDDAGNLTELVDGLGHLTANRYDARGNLIERIDAAGQEYHYEFNTLNLKSATIRPDGSRATSSYGPSGRLESETEFDGSTTNHVYDHRGDLVATVYADGNRVDYSYDAAGHLVQIVDATGTITQSFNQQGQLLSRTDGDGSTVQYEYDAVGRRTAVVSDSHRTEYEYDAVGNLIRVSAGGATVANFTYDARGNAVETRYASGVVESRQFDETSRLTELTVLGSGGETLASRGYGYDAAGRIVSEIDQDGMLRSYEYDAAGQLTRYRVHENGQQISELRFDYDSLGNVIQKVENGDVEVSVYDVLGQRVTTVGGGEFTQFEYDASGNLTGAVRGGDEVFRYTWDARGRMVSAAVTDSSGVTGTVDYAYDWTGLLKSRTDASGETTYVYDRSGDLPQLIVAESGGETEHYVHADRLVARLSDGQEYAYHFDAAGNPIAETDDSGAVAATRSFTPFGVVDNFDQPGAAESLVEFGFAGEPIDAMTGLTYLRQRHYSSGLQQFVSPDPLSGMTQIPLSQQPYQYAYNSPLKFSDPSGEMPSLAELQTAASISATIATLSIVQLLVSSGHGKKITFNGPLASFGGGATVGVGFSLDLYTGMLASDKSYTGGPNSVDGYRLSLGAGATFGWSAGIGIAGGPVVGNVAVSLYLNPVTRILGGTALTGALILGDITAQAVLGKTPGSFLAMGFAKGDANGGSVGFAAGATANLKTGLYGAISVAVEKEDAAWVTRVGNEVGADRIFQMIEVGFARYF